MTQKTKQLVIAIIGFVGGGFVLAVVGMAAQFWIATEVAAQLSDHSHTGSIAPIKNNIASIQTDIENINTNVDRALQSQQRFEEIFMEYLREQAD
jgi:hypothetical protein